MKKISLIALTSIILAGCSAAPAYEYATFEVYKLTPKMSEVVEYQMFSDDICGDDKYDAYLAEENVIIDGNKYTEYLCITPKAYQVSKDVIGK